MRYSLEDVARALKEARRRKRLSQRALSRLCGLPQGQISKIENGAVDLRVSSLIEIVRALELELNLIPRAFLPAVHAIVRNSKHTAQESEPDTVRPAYGLDEDDDG